MKEIGKMTGPPDAEGVKKQLRLQSMNPPFGTAALRLVPQDLFRDALAVIEALESELSVTKAAHEKSAALYVDMGYQRDALRTRIAEQEILDRAALNDSLNSRIAALEEAARRVAEDMKAELKVAKEADRRLLPRPMIIAEAVGWWADALDQALARGPK